MPNAAPPCGIFDVQSLRYASVGGYARHERTGYQPANRWAACRKRASKPKVQNNDGSSHVEEIIAWDVANRIALRFQEFSSPLQNLATHFIETWEFRKSPNGTEASRIMTMYPKRLFGWLMLIPISKLMKKAFEQNLRQTK